jgi:antitoxin ParD1/3/4
MLRIHLPAELEVFVQQLIESGEYSDPSAIVHDALWLFRDNEALRAIKLAELRKLIAVGAEQADRGQVAPVDFEAIKAKAAARLQREQEEQEQDAASCHK